MLGYAGYPGGGHESGVFHGRRRSIRMVAIQCWKMWDALMGSAGAGAAQVPASIILAMVCSCMLLVPS